jgi:hypothetical protein
VKGRNQRAGDRKRILAAIEPTDVRSAAAHAHAHCEAPAPLTDERAAEFARVTELLQGERRKRRQWRRSTKALEPPALDLQFELVIDAAPSPTLPTVARVRVVGAPPAALQLAPDFMRHMSVRVLAFRADGLAFDVRKLWWLPCGLGTDEPAPYELVFAYALSPGPWSSPTSVTRCHAACRSTSASVAR